MPKWHPKKDFSVSHNLTPKRGFAQKNYLKIWQDFWKSTFFLLNDCILTGGGGTQLFFQVEVCPRGVCSPDFRSGGTCEQFGELIVASIRGLANWKCPTLGACELKISKSGGLLAKIWAKIEVAEAKILIFFWKGMLVNWLLLEMGPLWTTGEAWKGGLQCGSSPYPLSRSVPRGGGELVYEGRWISSS